RHSPVRRFWRSVVHHFAIDASMTTSSPRTWATSRRSTNVCPISTSVASSASVNWVFWNAAIGWPKAWRCCTYAIVSASARRQVGAGTRLGHADADQGLAADRGWEPASPLVLAAVGQQVGHADRGVHGRHEAVRAVPGELFHDDRVEEEVAAPAAVGLGQGGA